MNTTYIIVFRWLKASSMLRKQNIHHNEEKKNSNITRYRNKSYE